ncbi:MAG: transketolase [Clostridiales bacterium]|jgi:transketolase|nr:transketolase [Clostridiales bacterium]
MDASELKRIAHRRRLDVLEMVKAAGTGHIGGSMSCMDILVCLYYEAMDARKILARDEGRDRFILSKGHCAEALYAVYADLGLIPKEALGTYAAFGTILAEHPSMKVSGVEAATGALGHGLSIGVGMALGLRADGRRARVYVLMGDGELAEGSVWEAAMSAAKYGLDRLVAIIDRNRLQISGDTEDIMPLESLPEKFRAFGWDVRACDGHDPASICAALAWNSADASGVAGAASATGVAGAIGAAGAAGATGATGVAGASGAAGTAGVTSTAGAIGAAGAGRPLAIIARTIKGYGSKVTENKAGWHHLVPSDEEYRQIKADLEAKAG